MLYKLVFGNTLIKIGLKQPCKLSVAHIHKMLKSLFSQESRSEIQGSSTELMR